MLTRFLLVLIMSNNLLGEELPASNACITVDIPEVPEEWESVCWVQDGGDICIIVQAPKVNDEGNNLVYKFDLCIG